MVSIDFGEFSHLLHTYDHISQAFENLSNLGIFEQKAWAIAHGFDRFWVNFKPFGNISSISQAFENLSKLGIFEQKAWAIAHGFDRFWGIFTPFGTIGSVFLRPWKSVKIGHFWAKSMGYSPWFRSILGNFHTFCTIDRNICKILRKLSILAIFQPRAWAITHGSDRFWGIFTPFGKYDHISEAFENCLKFGHFWA